MPEPQTPTREEQNFDQSMARTIERHTSPLQHASYDHIGGDTGEPRTRMSTMDTYEDFDKTFIPKFLPRNTTTFNDMITKIKDNIGKVLSDDELTTLEARVGDDVSSIVADNTTKWSNDIFMAISEDNVRN